MNKFISATIVAAALVTGVYAVDSASAQPANYCKQVAVKQFTEKHKSSARSVSIYTYHCSGDYVITWAPGPWAPIK